MKKVLNLVAIYLMMQTVLIAVFLVNSGSDVFQKIKVAWSNLESANNLNKYDLIVAGDSRSMYGIAPSVFQKELKLKNNAFNFAFPSNSYTASYLSYLEQRVQQNGRILLGITPQSLTRYEMSDIFDRLHHGGGSIVSAWQLLKLVFKNLIPHWNLKNLLARKGSPKQKKTTIHTQYHPDGQIRMYCDGPGNNQVYPAYLAGYAKEKFDPTLFNGLIAQVRAWRQQGLKVYFFYPPRSSQIAKLEADYQVTHFNSQQVVKQLTAAGAKFLHAKDDYKTCDGDHIPYELSKKLSAEIVQQIDENN